MHTPSASNVTWITLSFHAAFSWNLSAMEGSSQRYSVSLNDNKWQLRYFSKKFIRNWWEKFLTSRKVELPRRLRIFTVQLEYWNFNKSSRISDPLRKLNVPTKKGMCSYCVQTVLTAFLQLETSNGVSKNLLVSAQQDCKATIFISSRTRVVYLKHVRM